MLATGLTLFDTAIGPCSVAWSPAGITHVQLPEASASATRARIAKQSGASEAEPPPAVSAVIGDVIALLEGSHRVFAGDALDLHAAQPFERSVYDIALTIPPGSTLTYGEIASRLGDRGAARAVGAALGANPVPIIVPCHRVLAANGRMGGFSGSGGVVTKLRLLEIEGWRPDEGPTLFDGQADFRLSLRP
jgi:methylated-DNA-[protein]-cysteine S-methyltransferase